MKTFKAGFQQVGSLIAGVLIGLSMVIIACMFTMTAAESSHSQILLALGASIVFAIGVMLQIVMTAAPRQPAPFDRSCTTSTHSTGQEEAFGDPAGPANPRGDNGRDAPSSVASHNDIDRLPQRGS